MPQRRPSGGEHGGRWGLGTLPCPVSPESAEGTEDRNVLTDPNTQEKLWSPVFRARWKWR